MEMSHRLNDDNNGGRNYTRCVEWGHGHCSKRQKLIAGCLKHAHTGARKYFKGKWMLLSY